MAINLGTIFAQIGLDTSLLRAGVKKANVQLKQAEKGIGGFIKRNEKNMLRFGAAGVAAVGAIGIASIKMAGDFDQAMRNVNTITKVSEEQFKAMKEEVIALSTEVPQTAQELSEGLFNVASAGVQAAEQMNFLTTSARAATAGQANLSITVKGLSGVIKGFGDSFENADKVADLFFKTNELGVTTFEELAGSMGKVVPIAAALGVTQEELFAATATLTGVTGNTAEVMTQLKAAFTNLVKPTKDAEDISKKLGISFDATSIQTLGLAGFLEQVQDATGGNVAEMGKLFGSVEGLNAILALTGSSSEKFASNLDAMGNAAGAATDAFSEQQKGLNNQLKILKNNVSAIALDIGGKIIPSLTKFTTRINELDDETKDNIATTAEWGLGIIGVTSVVSLLLVGGKRLLAMLGPWGKAIAVVVAATTTHFKITEKLSSLIDNEWGKSIVKSLSLIGSFTNSIDTWSVATKFAEENNKSLLSVLFMWRNELNLLNSETEEAIDTTNDFTGSLEAEKVAMQISAEGLRIRTQRQLEANTAIEDGEGKIEGFTGELVDLGNETSKATILINGLRIAIEDLPLSKTITIKTNFITGGIPAGQAIRETQNVSRSTTIGGTVVPVQTPSGQNVGVVTGGQVSSTTTTKTKARYTIIGGTVVPLQEGGIVLNPGQFLVGERGPEVVSLPRGAEVTPNERIGEVATEIPEIVIPVTVELDGEVLFESVERVANVEEFRRIS